MVASLSNAAVSRSPSGSGTPRSVPRKPGAESAAESGGIVPAAFESLLNAARTIIAAERMGGGKASPFQVFEPNVADSSERREAALKEENRRTGARLETAERHGRASVESRRAAQSARLPESAGTHGAEARSAQSGAKEISATPVGGLGAPEAAGDAQAADAGRPAVRAGDTVLSAGRPRTDPVHEETLIAGRPADPSGAARGAPNADRPFAATAVPLAGPGGTRPETLAQQAAQLLAAGRVGEGEGGRAVPSPPAAGDTRPSGAEQRPAGRGATARQAGGETPSRAGEGAEGGKPGGAARSPFEELVRSIRLQTGSRWSSATLHLEPPRLGRVRVEVKLAGKALNIDVLTETPAGRDAVTQRAAELRAALEQQGVRVEHFEVFMEAPGRYDLGSDDGAGSLPNGDPRGGEQAGPSRPAGVGGSGDWTEASGNPDVVVDEAVVSETRLDIRV